MCNITLFPSHQLTTKELGQKTQMFCFMLIRVIILAVAATGPRASCCEHLITSHTLPTSNNRKNFKENIVFVVDQLCNQLLVV